MLPETLFVTAAHQYPTGGVLPADRRTALLSWAKRRPGVVIEDDYDAEYRYDRDPVGALQGLAPDRVVYAGSASKILAPGLRLGWFLVPTVYADAVAAAKRAADSGSPAIDQLAFADFLARGEGLGPEEAFDAVQEAFHTFLTLPSARTLVDARDDSRNLLVAVTRNLARNRRQIGRAHV